MKQKFTLLISLLIIILNLTAQPLVKASRTIGGANGYDNETVMINTKDGGFLVGGYSNSSFSGNKTDSVRGNTEAYDYWIVKYNKEGKIELDKTIGGNNSDYLTCIQQTTDGGYILGGYSSSDMYAEKSQASRGRIDYWIVKLDEYFNIVWDRTYGGNEDDYLNSIQQTTDGGYILGGLSNSNISGEKSQNRNGGSFDFWIIKINSQGIIEWDKTLGDTYFDGCSSIVQTADDGYFAAGSTENNNNGIPDYLVMKLDASGNKVWSRYYGGYDDDELTRMVACKDGNYLLAGFSNSPKSGFKSEVSRGDYDYWLLKIDPSGNYIWDKTLGGSDYEELTNIIETNDGNFIINGYSASGISGDKTEVNRNTDSEFNTQDYWVTKIDSSGKLIWDKTLGGGGDEISGSVLEVANHTYIVGGYSASNISGDKKQNTKSGLTDTYDYWLVSLFDKPVTAIAHAESISTIKKDEPFTVFPNPAKNKIYIQNNNKNTYKIINASGQIILTETLTSSGLIDISKLTPGIYYIKDFSTNTSKKILVVK